MRIITEEIFITATGRKPVNDDLELCNCPKAGEFMHTYCGWNEKENLPQYVCGPLTLKEKEKL